MPFQKPDYRQSSVNPGNHLFWFGNYEHGDEGNFNVACHTLYAAPFYTGQGGLVQNVAIRCVTGDAGANTRIALYGAQFEANADLYPHILLLDCGSFPMTATASTISNTTSFVLPANSLIWVGIITDGRPTVRGFAADKSSVFGTPMTSNFGITFGHLRLTAASYGQAWPTQFPSSCAPVSGATTSCPIVAFQITVG